ncbi:hypothetical protein F4556_005109 [Kitasatospora gansuensis]|uniref:Uncharacterized protein n=1 Tax=Kitasatospora gansuensis TaxID=258050 RepID=A0A7W7WKC7_9ACTN|nr:hypothetical protein [Kitasatospora gansuensis]MBB4949574.1 hypothetical protein [Kitasatospora gansuensis]
MLYLANPSTPEIRHAMTVGDLGCITTPLQGNTIPPGAWWAADNGRFGKGWPGPERWWTWLTRQVHHYGPQNCLFAVAPDRPFDAAGTFTDSTPWLPRIRSLGIPAAYAAQDGCDTNDLLPWPDFDVLFLAGTTEWKTGPVAERLARQAHQLGKPVHMGRVNSRKRLRLADWFGCASADGTYLTYGPDQNLPRLLDWLNDLDHQPTLLTPERTP